MTDEKPSETAKRLMQEFPDEAWNDLPDGFVNQLDEPTNLNDPELKEMARKWLEDRGLGELVPLVLKEE